MSAVRKKIYLFGVLKPKVGNFREHTLVLAKSLAEFHEVTIVSDHLYTLTKKEKRFLANYAIDFIDVLQLGRSYDEANEIRIYQFANNNPHEFILEAFLNVPGIALFHDISLYWLLSGHNMTNDVFLKRELGVIHGSLALDALDWKWYPNHAVQFAHSLYFNRLIGEQATGIITHSEYMRELLSEKFPQVEIMSLKLILNSVEPITLHDHSEVVKQRKKIGVKTKTTIFGVFGYMTNHKRIYDIVRAFEDLSDTNRNFCLVMAGEWDDALFVKCQKSLSTLRSRGCLKIINKFLKRSRMLSMMQSCDYILNLRYPTAGESSGVATEANALGVPVLYSRYAAFCDLDRHKENIPVDVVSNVKRLSEIFSNTIEITRQKRNIKDIQTQINRNESAYVKRLNDLVYTFAENYAEKLQSTTHLNHFSNERSQHNNQIVNLKLRPLTIAFLMNDSTVQLVTLESNKQVQSSISFILNNGISEFSVNCDEEIQILKSNFLNRFNASSNNLQEVNVNEIHSLEMDITDFVILSDAISSVEFSKIIYNFVKVASLGARIYILSGQAAVFRSFVKDYFDNQIIMSNATSLERFQDMTFNEEYPDYINEAAIFFAACGMELKHLFKPGRNQILCFEKVTNVPDDQYLEAHVTSEDY